MARTNTATAPRARTPDARRRMAEIQRDLNSAQEAREKALQQLGDMPDDKDAHALVSQIDDEIAEHQRKLQRELDVDQLILKRRTRSAREERRTLREGLRRRLAESEQRALAAAAKLESAVDALALSLMEWRQVADDRQADAFSIGRDSHSGGASFHDAAVLASGEVVEAVVRLLVSSGLGRVGPRLEPYVSVVEPSGVSRRFTLEEAIQAAQAKLMRGIDAAMLQIDAREEREASEVGQQ